MTNLWEDLETGPNPPEEIYAVVECLKGERNKYEYDKDVPGVVLDRVLHSNVHYPSDYGFLPQSYYDDEDPFDVMVLVEDQTFPGCVIEARPVALMKMDDDSFVNADGGWMERERITDARGNRRVYPVLPRSLGLQ